MRAKLFEVTRSPRCELVFALSPYKSPISDFPYGEGPENREYFPFYKCITSRAAQKRIQTGLQLHLDSVPFAHPLASGTPRGSK